MAKEWVLSRVEKYDPTVGYFVRDMRSSDIFNLSTSGALTGSAGTILATTTTSTNKELYLTAFVAGAYNNGGVVVTVGNSTILPVAIPANRTVTAIANIDAPLYKVNCTSAVTISIRAIDAGTYTAFLSGVYMPLPSKVEP